MTVNTLKSNELTRSGTVVVRDAVPADTWQPDDRSIDRLEVGAHVDLHTAPLYEYALRSGEGKLAATGPLSVETGKHTGRSPSDKFVVEDDETRDTVWWGDINQPLSPMKFAVLAADVIAYLGQRERFVQHLSACADPEYSLPVRVITDQAWAALFARNLFIVPETPDQNSNDRSGFTILHAPFFEADPVRHGVNSPTVIALNLSERVIIIAGTQYAGEIKKSIFTALQYLLPRQSVATMHCSANVGPDGDVALFFGLSGTGKTTLSSDPNRLLVGDDEHGWTGSGVFNFEGGSYAKVINLSAENEPDIWEAAHRFGTVLENVVLDPVSRQIRPEDDSLTENTRAAFPLEFFPNASDRGAAGHPKNIVLLTADAFGVLPPVARLTRDQALYWYLSGYTSKLAGTEKGVDEPEATFSACFGAPFLPLPPVTYANLLGEQIDRHQPALWLVNTGWSGGAFGTGERMPIALTRSIVTAITDGSLPTATTTPDPVFGLHVPDAVQGVASDVLLPRQSWSDPAEYDQTAKRLADAIIANFAKFADSVSPEVANAGPTSGS